MRALIVDDEANIRKVLRRVLEERPVEVDEAETLQEGIRMIERQAYDAAIVDIRLPDGSGIEALKAIKGVNSSSVVLVVTAFASTETAVEAMKAGAYDYLTKPFNLEEIRVVIRNVFDKIGLQDRVRTLQRYADEYQSIVGKSEAMQRLFSIIEKIAPFDSNVLIVGESGTGKELVAQAIHEKSRRLNHSLVAVNCASLPGELLESELFGYSRGAFTGAYAAKKGLIEEAHRGTLFLDEIGEMPASLQAKLLRFLEEKKIRPLGSGHEVDVDVRIVAATNSLLRERAAAGEFREDLFYRISTFELQLPSLRERRDDIPMLVEHFVKLFARKFDRRIERIDPAFMDAMQQSEFRGNVRELKNIIEREVILAENGVLRWSASEASSSRGAESAPQDLPDAGFSLDAHLSGLERAYLEHALHKTQGNKTKAADLLGLTFREFRYRLAKYKNAGG